MLLHPLQSWYCSSILKTCASTLPVCSEESPFPFANYFMATFQPDAYSLPIQTRAHPPFPKRSSLSKPLGALSPYYAFSESKRKAGFFFLQRVKKENLRRCNCADCSARLLLVNYLSQSSLFWCSCVALSSAFHCLSPVLLLNKARNSVLGRC